LFGPAAGRKEVLQTRLLLHLLVFFGRDGPAVEVAIIARRPAEDAAPAAPPAGGRVQEIDERNDRERGNDPPKPPLMPPNVCEHRLKLEIQPRTLPAPPRSEEHTSELQSLA